jgi:hypothetical protein
MRTYKRLVWQHGQATLSLTAVRCVRQATLLLALSLDVEYACASTTNGLLFTSGWLF